MTENLRGSPVNIAAQKGEFCWSPTHR